MNDLSAMDLVRFVCHVADEVPTVYVFGGLGEPVTREGLEEKAAMYPEWYTPDRLARLLPLVGTGIRGFDCSGLIKCRLMGGLEQFRYDPDLDRNSWDMYRYAGEKGPLTTLPEQPGVLLNMDGHVGVYLGGGQVIEATSAFRPGGGVQRTTLRMQKWESWYRHSRIRYGE